MNLLQPDDCNVSIPNTQPIKKVYFELKNTGVKIRIITEKA
jgi:hypothetical protein